MASLIDENDQFAGNCDPTAPPPEGYRIISTDPGIGMSNPYWDDVLGWLEGEPLPLATLPNWAGFRVSIMQDAEFQVWEMTLPAPQRENLKLAALAGNAPELQAIYTALVLSYPPPSPARDQWQGIADQNYLPLNFLEVNP